MKKKISLVLACILLLSAVAMLPATAAVQANNIFGVQLIKAGKIVNGMAYHTPSGYTGNYAESLTPDGLKFEAQNNVFGGFIFDYSSKIPQNGNYTLTFELAVDQNTVKGDYLYFGFDGVTDATSTAINHDSVSKSAINYFGWGAGLWMMAGQYGTDKAGMVINPGSNFDYLSYDDAKYLHDRLENGGRMKYEYTVVNNLYTAISVTPCEVGARTVTFNLKSGKAGMNAAGGQFAMVFRMCDNGSTATGILKNISVTPAGASAASYGVDLADQYKALLGSGVSLIKNGAYVFDSKAYDAELAPGGLRFSSSANGDGGITFDFKSLINAGSNCSLSLELAINGTPAAESSNELFFGYASLINLSNIQAISNGAGITSPNKFTWSTAEQTIKESGEYATPATDAKMQKLYSAVTENPNCNQFLKFEIKIEGNAIKSYNVTPCINGEYLPENTVSYTATGNGRWAGNGLLIVMLNAGEGNTVEAMLKSISFADSTGSVKRSVDLQALYTEKKLLPALTMQKGAGIRKNTIAGIRFLSDMEKSVYDELAAFYGKENLQFGTLIAPNAYVKQAAAFTHAAMDALDQDWTFNSYEDVKLTTEAWYRVSADAYTFAGSLVGFAPKYYTTDYAAVAYLAITAGGKTLYIYSDFDAEDHVRNIKEVYEAAMADQGSGLQNDQAFKDLYADVLPNA